MRTVQELEKERTNALGALEAEKLRQESYHVWVGFRIVIYILIACLLFFVYMTVYRKHDVRDDILGCLGFKEIKSMDFKDVKLASNINYHAKDGMERVEATIDAIESIA